MQFFKSMLVALLATFCFSSCSSQKEPMCGAYSDYEKVTDEDVEFFNQNYKGDVALTPKKVAKQVVAGLNYSFKCKGEDGKYEVVIYEPLPGQGEPTVSSVTKL